MTQSETTLLISGLVLGLGSGLAPGPLLSLVVIETLRHGPRAGFKVAMTPLLTDSVLIGLSGLFLVGLKEINFFLGMIALAGTGYLIYLAYDSLTCRAHLELHDEERPRTLQKSMLTNMLNPAPYLFWFTVGTPLLLKTDHLPDVLWFLGGFFSTIVLSKTLIALLIARSRKFLQSGAYRLIMRAMGIALLVFALLFFKDALAYFKGI